MDIELLFRDCALISVDIQEGDRPEPITDEALPLDWRKMGFTADDVNAANAFGWDVCLANAVRVVESCRAANVPRVFLHWGYQFKDGMDLDPVVRATMIRNHGTDSANWSGYIGDKGSQPAGCLGIQPGEYVLAKTAQDAFISSNIGFVLANLGARTLLFIGGHTEACLGKTATSAKRLGYRTVCIEDATSNARESTRLRGIAESQFDAVMKTDEFVTKIRQR
ncbi:MAG: isochorismatase family protein [Candidatus Hydrogenedentes bacterium]|nr:isochorismatase family protein [Candidatus Hydrogenedentota bacterium]